MLKALILSSVVLIATPVIALECTQRERWDPPERYRHAYDGKLDLSYLPQPEVVEACRELHLKWGGDPKSVTQCQRGCAHWNHDRSSCTVIVVNRTFYGATPEAVLAHELGHCNGWSEDHPH